MSKMVKRDMPNEIGVTRSTKPSSRCWRGSERGDGSKILSRRGLTRNQRPGFCQCGWRETISSFSSESIYGRIISTRIIIISRSITVNPVSLP